MNDGACLFPPKQVLKSGACSCKCVTQTPASPVLDNNVKPDSSNPHSTVTSAQSKATPVFRAQGSGCFLAKLYASCRFLVGFVCIFVLMIYAILDVGLRPLNPFLALKLSDCCQPFDRRIKPRPFVAFYKLE